MEQILLGIKSFIAGVTTILVSTVSVASMPTPTPMPTPHPVGEGQIIRSGEYSYQGYTLKYTVNLPKEGGAITGNFSGVCEGPISGEYDGKEIINGEAQATCKVAFLSYNLKAKYSGKLYLNEGRADINWEGEIPYTENKGNFSVNFEPVN